MPERNGGGNHSHVLRGTDTGFKPARRNEQEHFGPVRVSFRRRGLGRRIP